MTVTELALQLQAAQLARRVAAHRKNWTPSATPATDLGYSCERRIVYHRCWPNDAAPINDELASIFEEGNLHQRDVRAELALLGFEVVEAELNFRDERLQITGTIDGKLALPTNGDGKPPRVPIEIKSTAGSPPATAEGLRLSDSSLLRRYYAQMQAYLVLTSSPEGLMLFKSKQTGVWTIVAVALDYEYAEALLKKAERVRDVVAAIRAAWATGGKEEGALALLPNRIADRSECGGCPWRDTLCHPAEAPMDPLLLADDATLTAQLAERAAMKPGRDAYEKLDEAIKERFKLTLGDRFVVGSRWLVQKKRHGKGIRIDIAMLDGPPTE